MLHCNWLKLHYISHIVGKKLEKSHLPSLLNFNNDDMVSAFAIKEACLFFNASFFFQRKWEKYLELLKLQIIGYKLGFWRVINTTWKKPDQAYHMYNTSWCDMMCGFPRFFWLCDLSFWPIWKSRDGNLGSIVFFSVLKGRKCVLQAPGRAE